MIERKEVLVVAVWNALKVKQELFLRKTLIEANLSQVFLGGFDVFHLVILIHFTIIIENFYELNF